MRAKSSVERVSGLISGWQSWHAVEGLHVPACRVPSRKFVQDSHTDDDEHAHEIETNGEEICGGSCGVRIEIRGKWVQTDMGKELFVRDSDAKIGR
uniref:Uncharacterized protein n=1 Tax=Oryza sativa subsp. japonica TaxID=39947 RepID=Q5VRE0_ORYSJ|nr:hypothetical protein [Oryza sativa Japonica Group]BAD72172.1 hypothetical protein [Oryza sativa Japonica Group]